MNTNMMELNLNTRELNLEEMEQISGGWKWKDLIVTTLSCGAIGVTCGAVLGGLPGGVIGGAVGAGIGAGVCFM